MFAIEKGAYGWELLSRVGFSFPPTRKRRFGHEMGCVMVSKGGVPSHPAHPAKNRDPATATAPSNLMTEIARVSSAPLLKRTVPALKTPFSCQLMFSLLYFFSICMDAGRLRISSA